MDCSTLGFPIFHYLLKSAQTHVHWVSDVIKPSHPLPPPSPPALIFPSIRVFSNELALCIRWPKYWSVSFHISPSNEYQDWFPLGLTCLISLLPWDSLESSPAPKIESINSLMLRLLYGSTLTSIYDYWKNHSFDYMDLCGKVMSLLFNMLSRFVIAFFQGASVFSFHG